MRGGLLHVNNHLEEVEIRLIVGNLRPGRVGKKHFSELPIGPAGGFLPRERGRPADDRFPGRRIEGNQSPEGTRLVRGVCPRHEVLPNEQGFPAPVALARLRRERRREIRTELVRKARITAIHSSAQTPL